MGFVSYDTKVTCAPKQRAGYETKVGRISVQDNGLEAASLGMDIWGRRTRTGGTRKVKWKSTMVGGLQVDHY